jgi:hypothetical protein
MVSIIDFFHLVYPDILVAIFLVVALGIHILCQYFIRIRSDKKNLIWSMEILLIVLSTCPFFLLEYSADPFQYWINAVVSIPLLFFIPGFLIYSLFSQKIKCVESWVSEFGEVIFIQVLISILISGCIGLLLALLGIFSLFYVDLIILCGCLIIVGITKPSGIRFQYPKPRLDKTTYVLIAILFLALAVFCHPFPWILGGRDPGVYVNTGVNIANTGAIIIHDPFLASLDNNTQKLFYQIATDPEILNSIHYQGLQFPGFYITDTQTGEVTPQFFYLWPVWIALFYSIFGLEIALYVTPIFALLSVLCIYLVGKHLYNRNAGVIAAFILVLNFAMIWYARYPTTEIFTMFIIFSGIFVFLIFMRTSSPYYSCLAAVCFGELLLTRIDSVLIVIPPIVYILGSGIFGKFQKEQWAFLIPFILLGIYATAVALVVSAPYTFDIFNFTTPVALPGDLWLFSGIMAVSLSIIIIATICLKKKLSGLLRKISTSFNNILARKWTVIFIQVSVAVILTGYVIYNYFIRPSGALESDSYNLVKLSWYTAGLVGVSATVIGIIALIGKKPYRNRMFFLSIFGIFAVYQILFSNIGTDQPWWIRRYLPVVIPSMIICMGCCIVWLCSRDLFNGKHRVLRNGIACTLLILIVVPQGISDSAIVFPNEYNNAIEDLHNIANELNPDAIIVYKSNSYTDKVITPLYYIYNRTTVKYTSSSSFPTLLKWVDSGKTVYLIDAFESHDIISFPEEGTFTYAIHWTSFEGVNFQGMNIDNYYNYVILPTLPRVENHTLNIFTLNRTNILNYKVRLNGNWYDREFWQSIPTRWVSNNATFIYNSDENRTVNLTFRAGSFYEPRTLVITSGETTQIQQVIPSSFGEVSVLVPVKTGENIIQLYVPGGCERPIDIPELKSKDSRCLSIAIQNVTLL